MNRLFVYLFLLAGVGSILMACAPTAVEANSGEAAPASSQTLAAETVTYSDALTLEYAQPWLDTQHTSAPDPIQYSGALALDYAQPWLDAQQQLENDTAVSTSQTLEFDMAEDFTKYVFNTDIAQESGYPAHGSAFITQGYLYPVGTLDETDGINPDGSPEFPDEVIGTWICRGWIYGDIANEEGLPIAVTTQIFELSEAYGSQTIITDGFEYMQPGSTFSRAIIGGTGEYRGVRGEQAQEILGINEFMGMSMRFALQFDQ